MLICGWCATRPARATSCSSRARSPGSPTTGQPATSSSSPTRSSTRPDAGRGSAPSSCAARSTTPGGAAPGRVLGVDVAADAVDSAREHAASVAGPEVAAPVEFATGDFRTMGLAPGSFDVVHAHQVLQHLRDPVEALAAMAALARPDGGIVAARAADSAGMSWAPADERLDRWARLYLAVTTRNGADADAGRHLPRWARLAGLRDVTYTTSTWTFASPADRAWWSDTWAERVVASSLADQALEARLATPADLADIAAGWRAWAEDVDAVFTVVHGEIVARV